MRAAVSGLLSTSDGLGQLRAVEPVRTGAADCDALLARLADRSAVQLAALTAECRAGAESARAAACGYDALEAR